MGKAAGNRIPGAGKNICKALEGETIMGRPAWLGTRSEIKAR
jgi:hypothetical protein